MDQILKEKYDRLRESLAALDSVAVAFSGGVDSALLLWAAHDVLGEKSVAITAHSETFPGWEQNEAADFCRKYGIRQIVVHSTEMELEEYRQNPKNRCYYCKKTLFTQLLEIARAEGFAAVAEGSNMDDLGDYRPGLQAVAELGVACPLRMAELTKDDIRAISRELGLPTWKKPSYACLASRFVYGERITEEGLRMVERGEDLLHKLGFLQARVRIHGKLARIEVLPDEIVRAAEKAPELQAALRDLGFLYVTLDMGGYRTGSMNEAIGQ